VTSDILRGIKRLIFQSISQTKKNLTCRLLLLSRYGAEIHPRAEILFENIGQIRLGIGVNVGAYSVIHIRDFTKGDNRSSLDVGEHTYIGEQNNIRATGGRIQIGRRCLISQQVSIIAANHMIDKGIDILDQPWDTLKAGVIIGDDVWIGCGSQIMPGVKIGNGAVIAAGSVVVKDVEANSVMVGTPVRILRYRD